MPKKIRKLKVPMSRMTERQATKAHFVTKQITIKQYRTVLRRIAGNRYNKQIAKTKHRHSMSSSKWS